VCSRDIEAAVEEEEEIAQVASTLARANKSQSLIAWIKLIKKEELYLSINLPR
jgi:3-dehydroquinate dehydratase